MPKRKLTEAEKKKAVKAVVNNGLSLTEAEKLTGVSKSRIHELIHDYKNNPDIEIFKDNKDKVFEAVQVKLLNLADDETLKTMLNKRGFTDVGILQDKIATLRGQATEIHDVQIRALGVLVNAIPANSETIIDAEPVDN